MDMFVARFVLLGAVTAITGNDTTDTRLSLILTTLYHRSSSNVLNSF